MVQLETDEESSKSCVVSCPQVQIQVEEPHVFGVLQQFAGSWQPEPGLPGRHDQQQYWKVEENNENESKTEEERGGVIEPMNCSDEKSLS